MTKHAVALDRGRIMFYGKITDEKNTVAFLLSCRSYFLCPCNRNARKHPRAFPIPNAERNANLHAAA